MPASPPDSGHTNLIRHVEITLVLADEYPNYSICGLPFFLSGETPDWRSLGSPHRVSRHPIDAQSYREEH